MRLPMARAAAPFTRAGATASMLMVLALVAGCGGGGSSDSGRSPFPPELGSGGSAGGGSGQAALPARSTLAQQCSASNLEAKPGSKTGSLSTEKAWIRSYFDEMYLWREQVPQLNAGDSLYGGSVVRTALENYFYDLRTPQTTATGAPRDRFSFMMPEREWVALSESGVSLNYGAEWALTAKKAPRALRVAMVEPGSPAAQAGLVRGDRVLQVGGLSVDTGDANVWSQISDMLYPDGQARAVDFTVQSSGGATRTVRMTAQSQALTPVPTQGVLTAQDGAPVGYLLFNDHNLPAEGQLISTMQGFARQGVRDLVLDLRYNGGGYVFIASQLATMIAGSATTGNQVFDELRYNSRQSAKNERTPFYNTSCYYSGGRCTREETLPQLNLRRVYVLTQSGTCSASEAIINGLRGIGVQVVQIGGTTCGKPYGFSGDENCGYRYMAIEFQGVNAKGFGDYAEGFTPAAADNGREVLGCAVADDFDHALGDPAEGQLAAALHHRATGNCPPNASKPSAWQGATGDVGVRFELKRPWWREQRWQGRP
ncbi:S41 family peptidase [Roseateles sp. BYS180W]|uniref:S41 family peptidase n=1 Tax=Roseateles rivi TaxID=3299028 RepID=A0ABW7FQM8_9BURK